MLDSLSGLFETCRLDDYFNLSQLQKAADQLAARREPGLHSTAELIQWLDDMKAQNHILQERVGLNTLSDWSLHPDGSLTHKERKFFKVIGISVSSPSREVTAWHQPILDNVASGIIGLLLARWDDRLYFLMQAKAEVGNRNMVQIGPTVQFTLDNYIDNEKLKKPFLFEEFQRPDRFIRIRESKQSEEGARFYREEHLHRILMLPERMTIDLPPEYRWFSLEQIRFFLHLGEHVNSCARSILACLL